MMAIFKIFLLLLIMHTVTGTGHAEVQPRIAGGGYHSVALKADGTVWTWGLNSSGQLGFGNTTSVTLPRKVSFQNYSGKAVAAGEHHTLALFNDGKVRAWGSNSSGQLGINSTTDSNAPVVVKDKPGTGDLDNILAIAAGANHSLAVKKNGIYYSVWAWGNSYVANSILPVEISSLTGTTEITAVSAGKHHSVALKSDGTVWTWGLNSSGQLGDTSLTERTNPVQVKFDEINFLTGVTAIAAGGTHTVALKSDETVWTWGNNGQGQLGLLSAGSQSSSPVQVKYYNGPSPEPLTGVIAIAAGETHSAAITSDFKIWIFGSDGLITHPPTGTVNFGYAEHFNTIPNASQIVAGMNHTMAVDSDGLITSWGANTAGQLGRGYTSVATGNSSYPVLGFNMTSACRAMIETSCYESVAEAYQAASDNDTILSRSATLYEPLEFSRSVNITFSGEVSSEIRGPSLTISTDSLVIGNNMTLVIT